MKFLAKIFAVILSVVYAQHAMAGDAGTMSFDGTTFTLNRAESNGSKRSANFAGSEDPDFLETISVQKFPADLAFEQEVKSFISDVRHRQSNVRLKVLRRDNAEDVIIAFLTDVKDGKVKYRATRISQHLGSIVIVAYEVVIELGLTDDDQERRLSSGAIDALAQRDLGKL